MIKIIEEKINGEKVYRKVYVDDNGLDKYEKTIKITNVFIKEENYFLMYDSNMNVIRDVYRYLNGYCNDENFSVNTKKIIGTALKTLYTFLELFDYDINQLERREILILKQFILGVAKQGVNYSFEGIEKRSKKTFNKYISCYRAYFSFLGIENKVLNEKEQYQVEEVKRGLLGHLSSEKKYKYKINEKVINTRKTVPKYIRPYEYEQILKHIEKEYSLREEIIIRLMYENGLRIGEVLGLTLEDIDNEDNYQIYIRNRVTDDGDQHAKGCFFPINETDYSSVEYWTENVGYQVVKPKYELLDNIDEYIEMQHGNMSEKRRCNYLMNAKADKVCDDGYLENDNYYIFINKNGGKLKVSGWNKILRKILMEVGIQVDKGKRKDNLSHRFRHGFAMKRYKIDKVDLVTLAKDLRHSGIGAVMCYINPTEDEIYDANEKATGVMEDYMK